MQLNTVYMYACKTAINISKIIQASNKSGTTPASPSATINPAKIFSIICPTVMFATKRTVRLKGFDNKDIASIGTTNGAKATGIPLGKNVLKYPHFFTFIPTIILNVNASKDKHPTAAKWDVKVKL